MPPRNAAAVREQNRMAHDNYKLEVSIYQFTVGQLKADKESWTTRQAEGFKYLKSHLSYGMQRDLYVVADRGDLRDLNQTVEQLLDNRHEFEISSLKTKYNELVQSEGQSIKDYFRLRQEYEATLQRAGRGIPAA